MFYSLLTSQGLVGPHDDDLGLLHGEGPLVLDVVLVDDLRAQLGLVVEVLGVVQGRVVVQLRRVGRSGNIF